MGYEVELVRVDRERTATDPDNLSRIFPGQFQSPIVDIAVGVFPIKGYRSTRDFDVVNRETHGSSVPGFRNHWKMAVLIR
jgi:hypothetical protein